MLSLISRKLIPLTALLVLSATPSFVHAQGNESDDPIRVRDLRFTNERDRGGNDWYRIEIKIQANSNPAGDDAPNPRWVDDIEATLTVAFPVPAFGSEYTFYRASSKLVSVEARQEASFYFYLPWEIVERDRLGTRDPEFYAIEFTVGGESVPPRPSHFSRNIADAAALQNFRQAADSGVSRTEGMMVPTYLSPFLGMESRRNSPSYIRREVD